MREDFCPLFNLHEAYRLKDNGYHSAFTIMYSMLVRLILTEFAKNIKPSKITYLALFIISRSTLTECNNMTNINLLKKTFLLANLIERDPEGLKYSIESTIYDEKLHRDHYVSKTT